MEKGNEQEEILESIPEQDKPVSKYKAQKLSYFLGLYGGEHVSGTEFVVGASLVLWGVSIGDVILGLIIGNALAVLTWGLICAPIATSTRLTVYAYLKKIAGPWMQKIYNIVNGILFVFFSGAMVTISASAIRVLFGLPPQTHWYPTNAGFVVLVLCVGFIVSTIAAFGFKSVAQFSSVCAPWLLLIFIVGAIIGVAQIVTLVPGFDHIGSFSDFLSLANQYIWVIDSENSQGLSIYHVIAYAWLSNMIAHGALSDMAVLRFAKKSSYGFASAVGMYFGHCLAWICCSIMGASSALLLQQSITQIDSGAVAFYTLGYTGIIAVLIAGWTTSNPNIYRAGLAFQTIFTQFKPRKVTFCTGLMMTVVACFPFVFTKLLDFTTYLGIIVAPIGAIVVAEHWIFQPIGMTRFWSLYKGSRLNVPAFASWMLAIALSLAMNYFNVLHLFFLPAVSWIAALFLYIGLAAIGGAREKYPEEQALDEEITKRVIHEQDKKALKEQEIRNKKVTASPAGWITGIIGILAIVDLAAIMVLSIGVFVGSVDFTAFRNISFGLTIAYFIFAIIWIRRHERASQANS
ncbi:cytosine permease [Sporolactobacillus sp. THM19-2]|uniref:purine-cytosine permease family protein n=1 Tax=Sporolactobacillus sp. THM19-2 TaxID=2511171 RepID=UPI00102062D4|nr:nucleoside transporter [Sporolactobacillus sp. THM19-2]RYL94417.1 nucleoside transporter [Sporolactobacillus sp. THM19-2]